MKKQYLAKRLFALILAVSVCAAAIPVPVRAEETTASQETDVSEETAASEAAGRFHTVRRTTG